MAPENRKTVVTTEKGSRGSLPRRTRQHCVQEKQTLRHKKCSGKKKICIAALHCGGFVARPRAQPRWKKKVAPDSHKDLFIIFHFRATIERVQRAAEKRGASTSAPSRRTVPCFRQPFQPSGRGNACWRVAAATEWPQRIVHPRGTAWTGGAMHLS